MPLFPLIIMLVLLFGVIPAHAAGPTGFLNDTGQDTCDNGTTLAACAPANTSDAATYPRQDGRFGRDAKAAAGTLTNKTGAGAAGFDFTKVCFNGDLEGSANCTGTLVANTTAAAIAPATTTDWACTKDNVTNLVWSLESGNGNWPTYAITTLPNATNAATRCGYNTGWQLPTRRELLSIVHNGASDPAIDSAYFPGTRSDGYWSINTRALGYAFLVDFFYGSTSYDNTNSHYVRLVRSEQAPNTYTVTYDANGGSGSPPVNSNSYRAGATVTVLGQGTLTKSSTAFGGWMAQPSDYSSTLAPGSAFAMGSSNVTLYAQWACPTNMYWWTALGQCACNYLYVMQNGTCNLCPTKWTYTNGICICVKSKTNSCTQ